MTLKFVSLRATALNRRQFFIALASFLFTNVADVNAQAPVKIFFPYSVVNYSTLPWLIAKDVGLFRKHDLDVDLVFMASSALTIQPMLSRSLPVAGVRGPAVISRVAGRAEPVTVAAPATRTLPHMV